MSEQGFRVPEVCRIVGITYRQLDYWARTELVAPSIRDASGSGTQRLYSFQDLVDAAGDQEPAGHRASRSSGSARPSSTSESMDGPVAGVTLMSDGSGVYEAALARGGRRPPPAGPGRLRDRGGPGLGRRRDRGRRRPPSGRAGEPRREARERTQPTRGALLQSDTVRFAHASERQFARLLDFYQIEWRVRADVLRHRVGPRGPRRPALHARLLPARSSTSTSRSRRSTRSSSRRRTGRSAGSGSGTRRSGARSSTSATTCPW